jgi:hypothetical protein
MKAACILGLALAAVGVSACLEGLKYCGSGIVKGMELITHDIIALERYTKCIKDGDYEKVVRALEDADQPTDVQHVEDSLFYCGQQIEFREFCPKGCQYGGSGVDDYCL